MSYGDDQDFIVEFPYHDVDGETLEHKPLGASGAGGTGTVVRGMMSSASRVIAASIARANSLPNPFRS